MKDNHHDAYAALREPDFRKYLTMRFAMVFAGAVQSVCAMWWIFEMTHDPLALGLTGLFEAIPAISLMLIGGHFADKFNRKRIVLFCNLGLFLTWCFLACLPFLQNFIEKSQLIALIYCVSFFTGVQRAFYSPAAFSFLGMLVEKDKLSNAITWNSSVWEIANLTGLSVGGFFYSFLGVHRSFLVVAVLGGIGTFAFSRIRKKIPPPEIVHESAVRRISEGLKFVFAHQILIAAIALDMFAVLFGGAVSILPIFAGEILKAGSVGLGFLRAAPGFGALLMATYLAHRPMKGNAGRKLLWCVAGFGVAYIVFAVSKNFWLSILMLVFAGIFDELSVFIRMTLFQVIPPEKMKGRVSAVNSIFITSSNELGAFESGVAAKFLGTVPSVVFGGIMTILVVVVTAFFAPKLSNLSFEDLQKKES